MAAGQTGLPHCPLRLEAGEQEAVEAGGQGGLMEANPGEGRDQERLLPVLEVNVEQLQLPLGSPVLRHHVGLARPVHQPHLGRAEEVDQRGGALPGLDGVRGPRAGGGDRHHRPV